MTESTEPTTGRERIEAAFSARGTPNTPAVICYEGLFIRDHQLDFAPQPWWHMHATDLDLLLAFRSRVVELIGQDWFWLPMCPTREDRNAVVVEERRGKVWRIDRRSGREEALARPDIGGHALMSQGHARLDAPKTRTRDGVIAALNRASDISRDNLESGVWDLAAKLVDKFGRTHFPRGSAHSPLWHCAYIWDMEELMTLLADEPKLVMLAAEECLRRNLLRIEEQARAGAAGIWIEECMTDMISPAMYREFNLPFLRQLVDGIRAAGMKSIYYYCGNPADRWDLLLSAGADALALEESKKGWTIDVEDVVRRTQGRCVVLGNLDSFGMLEKGTDAQLGREIERQLQAGRNNGGRFIMSTGSPVTPPTPVSRVRRYCDLVHESSR